MPTKRAHKGKKPRPVATQHNGRGNATSRLPPSKRSHDKKWRQSAPIAPTDSKQARLIALLRAPAGCTLEEMMTSTGWQAHSVRGVISGVLRKKLGLTVTWAKGADGGPRIYRAAAAGST
jgi:hypothetical protein